MSEIANLENVRWAKAIEHLLEGASHKDAAAAAGVSDRTLRTWLSRPAFVGALSQAAQHGISEAAGILRFSAANAARTLVGMADGSIDPHMVRLLAASKVIDSALKFAELQEIMGRLAELEAMAAKRNAGGYAPAPYQGNRE